MTGPADRLAAALAGRYRLERELGRGGMAAVWLAQDLKHDRPVALKVLHPDLAATIGAERFLREIRLTARLQHPHLLPVLDSGDAGGLLWYAMPYIEGESLRDRLRRERQLPLEDALRIASEAAQGLRHAHEHGIVHRDVKPENILLEDGEAVVADFGIARVLSEEQAERLTATGLTAGTPAYMSPEQAAGERALDARADVYSLGCVLYEMLAGEPPFTGPTPQAILARRLSQPPPSLRTVRDVPPAVERAVERALARTPADRFASVGEFAAALRPDGRAEPARAEPARPWRTPARRAVAAVVLLLAALAGYAAYRAAGAGRAPPPASAAVLPFTDMSPGKDQEYFSDGLTEELITSLSRVRGLRVAARTSSFQFKGRHADVREVGRRLDVGTVLEGSVRRSGSRVRITAQLVSARDGYQLWSESYDRELADVFAVQEEIARAIVAALRPRLGAGADSMPAARPAATAPPTRDLAAYDLYLKGRFALNLRTAATGPEAVRYFEQAVARDPAFARAWAGLADAYVLAVSYGGSPSDVPRYWTKAKAAAARALALDSTLGEAHTALAYGTMLYDWNWAEAEASFRRALAATPNHATAHHWYGDFLAGRGRLDESLREMRRALELDPLSRIIGVELGWVHYLRGEDAEAVAQIRRTLAFDPNFAHGHVLLGLVHAGAGRWPQALAALRQARALGGEHELLDATLAYTLGASGDRAGALRLLRELRERERRGEIGAWTVALAHAGLGDTAQVLAWMHQAIDERDPAMAETFFDPIVAPYRREPRFAGVVARMRMAP